MRRINFKRVGLFAVFNCMLCVAVLMLTLQKPRFERASKIQFVGIEDSFLKFNCLLVLNNRSPFSISGKNLVFTLDQPEFRFGSGSIAPTVLKRFAETEIDVSIKLNYREIYRAQKPSSPHALSPAISISGDFLPLFFVHQVKFHRTITRQDLVNLIGSAIRNGAPVWLDSFLTAGAAIPLSGPGIGSACSDRCEEKAGAGETSGCPCPFQAEPMFSVRTSMHDENVVRSGGLSLDPFKSAPGNKSVLHLLLKSVSSAIQLRSKHDHNFFASAGPLVPGFSRHPSNVPDSKQTNN